MLIMMLGLQLVTPFDGELPETTALAPRHARIAIKMDHLDYPQILARPIFAADRLPMMEMLPNYTLLGIGIAGARSTALVQSSNGELLRLRPTDRLAGWQVSAITDTYVFFVKNRERRMLKLDTSRLPSVPKTAQTPAGAQ